MAGQGKNNTSVRANGDKKSCKHYVTKIIVWSSPHTPFSALLKRANFTSRKDRNKKSAENSNLDGLKFKILSFPPVLHRQRSFFYFKLKCNKWYSTKTIVLRMVRKWLPVWPKYCCSCNNTCKRQGAFCSHFRKTNYHNLQIGQVQLPIFSHFPLNFLVVQIRWNNFLANQNRLYKFLVVQIHCIEFLLN